MKTGSVTINGETYTLALTMSAVEKITEKVGGVEKFADAINGDSITEIYKGTLWALSVLLEGGRAYASLALNKEERAFTLEELGILCSVGEVMNYRIALMQAVSAGMFREVEVEVDRKNGDTMQMNP
jgi:hypothetical protein